MSQPDPQPTDRDSKLPGAFRLRDPLERLAVFARDLGGGGGLAGDQAVAVRAEWRAVMDDLIALASVQDAPSLASMTHDVYAPARG